jgi:hypothetical protein
VSDAVGRCVQHGGHYCRKRNESPLTGRDCCPG